MTAPGLQDRLATASDGGGRAFVPYVTGGLPGVDAALLRALAEGGADAIEVGVPFSDPVMDGPVIQEASGRALRAGATARSVLATIGQAGVDVPVTVMTYLNPILASGEEAFLAAAAEAGVRGVIVPDLPVDEAGTWREACAAAGVEPVFLAAPNSTPERLAAIAAASRGFVYCVASLGVTGARDALAGSARSVVEALRPMTRTPLLVGVGVSTPAQAGEACAFADGVVVGTALVRPLLDGDPAEALRLAATFRAAVHAPCGTPA